MTHKASDNHEMRLTSDKSLEERVEALEKKLLFVQYCFEFILEETDCPNLENLIWHLQNLNK